MRLAMRIMLRILVSLSMIPFCAIFLGVAIRRYRVVSRFTIVYLASKVNLIDIVRLAQVLIVTELGVS